MILIVSQIADHSTDNVMDWLYYHGKSCCRLNGEDILNFNSAVKIELDSNLYESQVQINSGMKIDTNEITSIWYRRDSKNLKHNLSSIKSNNYYRSLVRHLGAEYSSGKFAFYLSAELNKKKLGDFRKMFPNKMEVLHHAKNCGLEIPATIITNSKADLIEFKRKNINIITKAIQDGFDFKEEKESQTRIFLSYTEEITNEIVEKIPDFFFPSFFQEKLNKEIDIRVFYLDGKCYSMAIFSQLDTQTNTDFRKYNEKVNNRNVPFLLPPTTETKLNKLMLKLDLNTGSIDFVKTKDGRYVFLEVNPVGQYGMTSVPCNYYLDKRIAEYLE